MVRARLPNPKRIEADILFNQIEYLDVNLSLKIDAIRLSVNHHTMEPNQISFFNAFTQQDALIFHKNSIFL